MKKIIVFSLFGLLVACQQDHSASLPTGEGATVQKDATNLQEKAAAVTPTFQLEIPVSGMSCEMACGGAIRKELLSTNAVNRVKFDFKMARDTNVVFVKFDDEQISQEKIIALIQETNNGQFKTGKAKLTKLNTNASTEEAQNTNANPSILVPTEFPKVEIPSILDILSSIIFR